MDRDAFRRFLKRKGKKVHVVDSLVAQVDRFADYLIRDGNRTLDVAREGDIEAYAAELDAAKPGEARKQVRGLILYYQFCGNAELAACAGAIREQAIAKRRTPFALREFRGVDEDDIHIAVHSVSQSSARAFGDDFDLDSGVFFQFGQQHI